MFHNIYNKEIQKEEETDDKTELLKIAQEMVDTMEPLLEEFSDSYVIQMEDMWFRRVYLEETRDLLKAILAGEEVDYEDFYKSISLEMMANSRKWNDLRYWLRQMSWDKEYEHEILMRGSLEE